LQKSKIEQPKNLAKIDLWTGWFKEVHVKDIDSHSVRALLASRALLVKIKRDLENQVRVLLKNLGLVIGRSWRADSLSLGKKADLHIVQT
jgi:transposase